MAERPTVSEREQEALDLIERRARSRRAFRDPQHHDGARRGRQGDARR